MEERPVRRMSPKISTEDLVELVELVLQQKLNVLDNVPSGCQGRIKKTKEATLEDITRTQLDYYLNPIPASEDKPRTKDFLFRGHSVFMTSKV
jgi:hypothetical protein